MKTKKRKKKSTNYSNSTVGIFEGFGTGIGIPAAITAWEKYKIEEARALPPGPDKDKMKRDASLIASTINFISLVRPTFQAGYTLYHTWRHLSLVQRAKVCLLSTVALVGAGYEAIAFGHEKNTVWAGVGAGSANTALNTVSFLATRDVIRNERKLKEEKLLQEAYTGPSLLNNVL